MTIKGIECLACSDKIWSRSRYDFVRCRCGKTFVDGGRKYLRYGSEKEEYIRVINVEVLDAD